MKRIAILLLGVLTAIPALCQTQWIVDSTGTAKLGLMKVKFRDVTDTNYYSDGSHVYLIESNFPGTSMPHTQIGVLTYQHPLSVKPTAAQKKQIADFIKSVLEPVNIPNAVKVDNMAMTPGNGWVRNGETTSPGWYANTTAWSNVVGATIAYADTLTKVEIYAERKDTHGKGQITIKDGATEVSSVEVDYSLTPHGLPVLIWASPTLPRKVYTVELRVNSGTVLMDFINVYK